MRPRAFWEPARRLPSHRGVAVALVAAACLLMWTGCTRHETILDPRGMALAPAGSGRSIGHVRTSTCGVTLFGFWTIAPAARGSSLQYSYDAMAAEAATHGASRLLDLRSDRCNLYLLPFLLQTFSVTLTANMVE